MKINCDACGSKYSIADDKVRGKRVKVRCKSCQASILVDGTTMGEGSSDDDAAEDEAAIAPADTSSPVVEKPKLPVGSWSVNLSDDDSRDMTTAELVTAWKKGEVTADAYVWKDGMDDWTPIQDVPELKSKLGPAKGALPAKVPVAAKSSPQATKSAPRATDDGVTTSAKANKPAAKGRSGSMDDLFGGVDFAGKDEAPANPAAALVDDKPKGARNESSVLFSLDALKAGVEAEKPAGPAPKSDDPFGLGNNAGLGFGGGGGLGAFGGGFGGNAADLLTAPVKEPPRPIVQPTAAAAISGPSAPAKPKGKGLLIGAVVGVLALGGAAFAFMGGGSKADVKSATSEETTQVDAKAEAEKKAMADQLAKAEAEKKAMADQLAKAEAEKKKAEEASAADTAKKDETKPADPAKPTEAKPGDAKPAAPKTDAKPAAPAPAAAGIDMGAVKSALGAASAKASSCAKPGGPTGSGKVQVTFAPSGRVTNASITGGSFGGTAVGGCVASTFRSARVPAFSGAPVTVAKGFSIR